MYACMYVVIRLFVADLFCLLLCCFVVEIFCGCLLVVHFPLFIVLLFVFVYVPSAAGVFFAW